MNLNSGMKEHENLMTPLRLSEALSFSTPTTIAPLASYGCICRSSPNAKLRNVQEVFSTDFHSKCEDRFLNGTPTHEERK